MMLERYSLNLLTLSFQENACSLFFALFEHEDFLLVIVSCALILNYSSSFLVFQKIFSDTYHVFSLSLYYGVFKQHPCCLQTFHPFLASINFLLKNCHFS